MLSLTRKSEAQSEGPLWHPNFCNPERLPDTKVVRTTFFINTASIALALGLLMWLGYREYSLHELRGQIDAAQLLIDQNNRQNTEALRLSKIFGDEVVKITATENFLRAPISPVDYINLLGESLPREISIEYVDTPADPKNTKNQIFVLRGVVAGSRDDASGSASTYVDTLRAHPRIGEVFDPITLEKLTPDGGSGHMSFEIFLKVKTQPKK